MRLLYYISMVMFWATGSILLGFIEGIAKINLSLFVHIVTFLWLGSILMMSVIVFECLYFLYKNVQQAGERDCSDKESPSMRGVD